jgi:purine-nucleoside phosphorylase
MLYDQIQAALGYLRTRTHFQPRTGIVLGTGLGKLTDEMQVVASVDYADIPHFARSTVESHRGQLIFGYLAGHPVVVMAGRFHYYEGWTMQQVSFPIRAIGALGAERIVITNVSGGTNPHLREGDLVVVRDHINLLPEHPLRGENDERLGPRFPDMLHTYDAGLREKTLLLARQHGIRATEGVYASLQGPSLETPAEYAMLRSLGADCVGMSSVPEVIVARHAGLSVLMLSMVVNRAYPPSADLGPVVVEDIIALAQRTEPKMRLLIRELLAAQPDRDAVRIIDWSPQHQEAWKNLNIAWISRDYEVEQIDLDTLDFPEKYFISDGGAVLLAERDGEILGTVALQPFGEGRFELAKMTVAENARGLKIGEKLGWAALERARALGARSVFLYSNTKAYQAINLYFKLGFRVVPLDSQEFKRANIQMEVAV